MDVFLDGTPLLGSRTGIGHYVANLHDALQARREVDASLFALTLRGGRRPLDVEPGSWTTRRVPARLVQDMWRRHRQPTAELLGLRADVVHATNFIGPPPRRGGFVVTVHDLAAVVMPDTVHPRTLRNLPVLRDQARRADVVCTPTAAVGAEVVERLGVPADRVVVTPLGVDPVWATAQPPDPGRLAALGLPSDYLLAVGTQEPRKNLHRLVEAHAAVRPHDVPPLVLVGPPGWGPSVGSSDRVILLPYQPAADLRALVAGARALVFPSLLEGFGLPALEAMAAGTPVLASDTEVMREVTAGLARLVDTTATDPLAEALVDLGRRPLTPDELRRAREHAATMTWDACARATTGAYRAAAAGSAP